MPRLALAFLCLCLTVPLTAQTGPAPQTPRQVLIEIMFGEDRSVTLKHFPSALVSQLAAQPYAAEDIFGWLRRLTIPGMPQVFEAGPILAVAEAPGEKEKLELAVEKEELRGDEAEFVLAPRQVGEHADATLLEPRLVVNLRMEDGIWRLTRMDLGLRMRLDNAAMLERYFRQKAAERPKLQASMAVGAVRAINNAQVTYAVTYPNVGFTCSLTDLDGSDSGKQPSEHGAMLIDEKLASGKKDGYIFETLRLYGKNSAGHLQGYRGPGTIWPGPAGLLLG